MARISSAQFRVFDDYYNDQDHFDENALSNAFINEPDVLSQQLVWITGRWDKRYPISTFTEGINNVHYIEGTEYRYPVIGQLDKQDSIATTIATDQGVGHQIFKISFRTRWYPGKYTLRSPRGYQIRLMGEGKPKGQAHEYDAQIVSPSDTAYVPASELKAGTVWGKLFAGVAMEGSTGVFSRATYPSKVKNQIGMIRKSKVFEGNIVNRRIKNIEINAGATSLNYWMDWEEWQFMMQWREEAESMYWYSEYNRDTNGKIHLLDDNGKPIPMGSGIREQIGNRDTYSILTANKLHRIARDIFYNVAGAESTNIMMFTGTGGRDMFDRAMKTELANKTYIKLDSGHFVTGTGRKLALGGYFTTYEHIDGHTISIAHNPIQDFGPLRNGPTYDGLPQESYTFYYLDMSTYEGVPNFRLVTQKDRQLVRRLVPGMATLPASFGGNNTQFTASEIDQASIQYMKAGGINISNSESCFMLEMAIE